MYGKKGDEIEFLWDEFPDNAVWHRKDTQKWYGDVLTVSKKKLVLDSSEITEIINLRLNPDPMSETIDYEKNFSGWHMNKKHWHTIILDNSVPTKEICKRIDESYTLAEKWGGI